MRAPDAADGQAVGEIGTEGGTVDGGCGVPCTAALPLTAAERRAGDESRAAEDWGSAVEEDIKG